MSLSTTANRLSFSGDGVSTVFSYPYYFLEDSYLVVILRDAAGNEVTKTITTHYTVSGAGVSAGGSVTMLTAPAVGETLIVYRDPPVTQSLDLVENDALPAEEVEKAFDKAAMIDQRLTERTDRSVALSEGYAGSFDPTLPGTLTADYFLKVNAAGTGFELVSANSIGSAPTFPLTTKGDLLTHTGATTVRLPAGADGTILGADSTVTNGVKYYTFSALYDQALAFNYTQRNAPLDAINYTLAASAATGALTISLKDRNGANASSSSPVQIGFRSSTLTSGVFNTRSVTGALSTVISSGSTAGFVSSVNQRLYVYALDNAGTVELAWAGTRVDEAALQTTTAEGGAGAADSKTVLYSTTARSSVPVRYLGFMEFSLTAGTWVAPTTISVHSEEREKQHRSEVYLHTSNGYGSTATKIRRFTTAVRNTGTAITYADSATNGATFTINEDGLYSISYVENFNTDGSFGISLNNSGTTTNIDSITVADRVVQGRTPGTGKAANCCITLYLQAGDVLRPHTNGDAAGTVDQIRVFIAKVGL